MKKTGLTGVDKVFYFILCVGYIASEEVERGEKENWPAKQALRSLEENKRRGSL